MSLFQLANRANGVLFHLPAGLARVGLLAQIGQFRFDFAQAAASECASVSLSRAWRSISSCMMRRSISSISTGSESICMRSAAADSSTRSMALSGRKRSVM